MGKLITAAITSLDGYINDESGNFDWGEPDDEVHAFVNDLERSVGTYLYGRRMYEVMRFWETAHELPDEPQVMYDYAAVWQSADKIVYSTGLGAVSTARTRLVREFDAEAVRRLKSETDQDISIAGPHLAALAIRAGLVDEYCQFVSPIVVGGGTRWLPDGVRIDLELIDERRFNNGVVYLRYRLRS